MILDHLFQPFTLIQSQSNDRFRNIPAVTNFHRLNPNAFHIAQMMFSQNRCRLATDLAQVVNKLFCAVSMLQHDFP